MLTEVALAEILVQQVVPHLRLPDVQALATTCQALYSLVADSVPSQSWAKVAHNSLPDNDPVFAEGDARIWPRLKQLGAACANLRAGSPARITVLDIWQGSAPAELSCPVVASNDGRLLVGLHEGIIKLWQLRPTENAEFLSLYDSVLLPPHGFADGRKWHLEDCAYTFSSDDCFVAITCQYGSQLGRLSSQLESRAVVHILDVRSLKLQELARSPADPAAGMQHDGWNHYQTLHSAPSFACSGNILVLHWTAYVDLYSCKTWQQVIRLPGVDNNGLYHIRYHFSQSAPHSQVACCFADSFGSFMRASVMRIPDSGDRAAEQTARQCFQTLEQHAHLTVLHPANSLFASLQPHDLLAAWVPSSNLLLLCFFKMFNEPARMELHNTSLGSARTGPAAPVATFPVGACQQQGGKLPLLQCSRQMAFLTFYYHAHCHGERGTTRCHPYLLRAFSLTDSIASLGQLLYTIEDVGGCLQLSPDERFLVAMAHCADTIEDMHHLKSLVLRVFDSRNGSLVFAYTSPAWQPTLTLTVQGLLRRYLDARGQVAYLSWASSGTRMLVCAFLGSHETLDAQHAHQQVTVLQLC